MTRTRIVGAEVDGRCVDVVLDGGFVTTIVPTGGRDVDPRPHVVVRADGGALLPGLHDHHLHVLAMAAAAESVAAGPDELAGPEALGTALAAAPDRGDGWVRGFGYHESVAGDLDRDRLDAWVSDRPVRVQHRTGALWMLNSRALDELGELPDTPDVERDARGRPTGRLWRMDDWLATRLPAPRPPDLAAVGRRLLSFGITSATDATPDLSGGSVALLGAAVAAGQLPPLHLLFGGDVPEVPGLTRGPRKILLRDHDLPDFEDLTERVERAHGGGRPVAVHVVTRESLVLTIAVLDAVGTLPGDRIEHAAVVPADLVARLRALGVAVVTQPGFLRARGDDYLRDVDPDDQQFLYPHHCLLAAGVGVGVSSDAPYGPLDPWSNVTAAAVRLSRSGRRVGADLPVSALEALAGYLSDKADPGGPSRRVTAGVPADLVLLDVPLVDLAERPDGSPVRQVWRAGQPVLD